MRARAVQQVLSWRTRGQCSLGYLENGKLVLAKAGIKLPGRRKSKDEENEAFIELFLNRKRDTELQIEVFRSMREIWHQGGDLTSESSSRKIRLDFDWKRKPFEIGSGEIRGNAHLAFTTQPWRTVKEFLECRDQWEIFFRESKRCLHSAEDLQAFLDYLQTSQINQHGVNRSIKKGPVYLAAQNDLPGICPIRMGLHQVLAPVMRNLQEMSYSWGF